MSGRSVMLLILTVTAGLAVVAAQHYADEDSLRTAVFTSYKAEIRPSTSMSVNISMAPLSLNSLDITQQTMSITAGFLISWYDDRLTWTPATYGNIDTLVVAPESVWTPSLVVENEVSKVGKIGGERKDNTYLRVQSNGLVTWYPPLLTTTSCDVSIFRYPFDSQTCQITMSAWSYSTTEIELVYRTVMWDYYSANAEWDWQDNWLSYGTFFDGSVYFRRTYVYFSFRRKWQFYSQNLILPIVLTSVLTCCIFLVPVESGEKLGYTLTVLLSYMIFLTWVTDTLPPISNDTSMLQVYLAAVLCLGVLATVLTCWVVHISFRPSTYPMSAPMRAFVKRVLIPLYNWTCCKRPPRSNVVQVLSNGSNLNSLLTSTGKDGDDLKPEVRQRESQDSVKTPSSVELETEKAEELPTWKEVAVMFDYFFLMLYMGIKPAMTVGFLVVLYGGYS